LEKLLMILCWIKYLVNFASENRWSVKIMTESGTNKRLIELLSKLNIEANEQQINQLQEYVHLLFNELKIQRVTGEKTIEGIVNKQIYDSIYLLNKLDLKYNKKVLDLGTGGGLPGIPIKIVRQDLKLCLLDSIKKKTAFLEGAVKKLRLDNTCVLEGRAENFAHITEHREQYDYVFSKAVAEASVLAELTLPFLRIGGRALFYKGPKGKSEIEYAEQAINICGGVLEKSLEYFLETGEKRAVYIIKKINNTPEQYPRSAGKPQKKPLGI